MHRAVKAILVAHREEHGDFTELTRAMVRSRLADDGFDVSDKKQLKAHVAKALEELGTVASADEDEDELERVADLG